MKKHCFYNVFSYWSKNIETIKAAYLNAGLVRMTSHSKGGLKMATSGGGGSGGG